MRRLWLVLAMLVGLAAAAGAQVVHPPTPGGGLPSGGVDGQCLVVSGTTPGWGSCAGSSGVTASGTLTPNRLMLGGGTTVVTALGSLGTTTTLLHGNAAGAPTYGAVALSTDVSGTLPATSGGTGQTGWTSGGIPYANTGTTLASSAELSANNVLLGGGPGAAPTSLSTATYNATYTGVSGGEVSRPALVNTIGLISSTTRTTASGSLPNVNSLVVVTPASNMGATDATTSVKANIRTSGSNNVGVDTAVDAYATHAGTGTIVANVGVSGWGEITATGGTATSAIIGGVFVADNLNAANTVPFVAAILVDTSNGNTITHQGTYTRYRGISIGDDGGSVGALPLGSATVSIRDGIFLNTMAGSATTDYAFRSLAIQRSVFTGNLAVGSKLAVGGDFTPVNNGIEFVKEVTATVTMQRATTSATSGTPLTIAAGDAVSGGTNRGGGQLTLTSGLGTGSGQSSQVFYTYTNTAGSTSDNTIQEMYRLQNNKISWFGATPVVKQTRGATLTNSVTSGGTDDTIADIGGTVYATDGPTIRSDLYQLARIVRMHDVALRSYGLEN